MLFGKRLKKRVISILGLSTVAIVVQLLDSQRPRPADLFSDLPDQHLEPDYYTINSTFREFDVNGNLSRTLQSKRLVHYPENESTFMEQPLISTLNAEGSSLWQAKGDKGHLEGDGEHLSLTQNVVIWKTEHSSSEPPLKLLTDSIEVNFETNIAHSNSAIELISQFGATHAIGLEANMNNNQIKLLNQVRGTYAQ